MSCDPGGWRTTAPDEPGLSPYIDWWREKNPDATRAAEFGSLIMAERSSRGASVASGDLAPQWLQVPAMRTQVIERHGDLPKFFDESINTDYPIAQITPEGWLPPADLLPAVAQDTVIVGVIDTDIALGNARFRDANGHSRILAAWQMNAVFAGQVYLPFGQELYLDGIEKRLATHSGGSLTGPLDEPGFNTAAGLLDIQRGIGQRGLAGRFAHGTHVLDLAAGCAPQDCSEFARRAKVIAVNLPDRRVFGLSGEFLDFFMLLALQRIVALSDAIWRRNNSKAPADAMPGYPMIVNLSFGRQAGAKDDRVDLFARAMRELQESRKTGSMPKASPLDVVMPAGNDNLARVHAEYRLDPGADATIAWLVQPGDQSDNFAEVWAYGTLKEAVPTVLGIALAPPGEPPGAPEPAKPGTHKDVGPAARIYCRDVRAMAGGKAVDLEGFLLCTSATERPDNPECVAPAGAWSVTLKNWGNTALMVRLTVQTDQSVLTGSATSRRSRFDDPAYRRYGPDGAEADTFRFAAGAWQALDEAQGTRRHGTLNASSAHAMAACVGGYRASDGMPAPYSATGIGRETGGRGAPTASLPTDEGPAHPGILASGAATGSVVAMRGTSFAAAQATRFVAARHIEDTAAGKPPDSAKSCLRKWAARHEAQQPFAVPHEADLKAAQPTVAKLGRGRIRPELDRPMPRKGHT